MSSKAMSLKAKIRNLAKTNKISAQVILQNYMFERFLERISKSQYKDKFILKGGMLVAFIIGLDSRSTIDMDTTLRGDTLWKKISLLKHSLIFVPLMLTIRLRFRL